MKKIKEVTIVEKLKSIRIATPEEVEAIAKEQWESEKMQDYVKKSYDFYILEDGYYLEIEKVSKLGLDKQMWFDDEYEIPTANEDLFISYNMRMHNPMRTLDDYLKEKNRLETTGGATGLYDYNGLYLVCYYKTEKRADIHCYYEKDERTFKRYLTQDEQQDYINIMQDLKDKYLERLKKYYKRYGQHVHSSGYWVNR